MVIACPSCKARFNLDGSKIGPKGVKVRCTKCSTLFMVRKPASKANIPAPAPEPKPEPKPKPLTPMPAAPMPAEPDPFGDETRVLSADLAAALREAEPDPFGDETRVLSADLAAALREGEEQASAQTARTVANSASAAPDPLSSNDFAWDQFEPEPPAVAPEQPAPALDDDLFNFGDPSVGLDAPLPEVPVPTPAAAPDPADVDSLIAFDDAISASAAKPGPALAPEPGPALAPEPPPGTPSDTFDASAAAPGAPNLEHDLFGDLAEELSVDTPPSQAAAPVPQPQAALPEPVPAPRPAADLEQDLFGDLAAEFSVEPDATAAAPAPAPEPQPAAPAVDISLGEFSFEAVPAPAADAPAAAPAPAPAASSSGELAKDLFGDLSIESPAPAAAAAPSDSAAAFDFDSIDMSDGQASAPAAARGEDLFGGGDEAEPPMITGSLDLDFDAAIRDAGGQEPELIIGAPALAPAPAKKTPSRPGTAFFAQSGDAIAERPDWYGRSLAVIGGAASLVLAALFLFSNDKIDFDRLSAAWLLGEHTIGRTEDLVTDSMSAFAYSSASGRSLLVVEGAARNQTGAPIQSAKVRATIYDYVGRLVYARTGKLGCSLSPQQVHTLERETDLDTVCAQPTEAISPGQAVPFVVVFFDAPVRIARYRYSIDLSTARTAAPAAEPPAEPKAKPEPAGSTG